ncbi:MAG: hypothetical protein IKG96_00905 [Bacteroidaceae bacterium]|nr:hypothetical protein [Bacteroidaceae bacterium]
MAHILTGQVLVNGTDIWQEYGVFLTEEKKGGRENQNAILAPSKVKAHVGVDFRERNGKQYAAHLDVKNEEREVTLHFAQYAQTRTEWLTKYRAFIQFLKTGEDGWLNVHFPSLGLTLRMYYVSSGQFRGLTYLWNEGVQAGRYKVTFKEPEPII